MTLADAMISSAFVGKIRTKLHQLWIRAWEKGGRCACASGQGGEAVEAGVANMEGERDGKGDGCALTL